MELEETTSASGRASVTNNPPVIPLVKGSVSDDRIETFIGTYRNMDSNMAASSAASSVVRTHTEHAIETMTRNLDHVDKFDETPQFTTTEVNTEGPEPLSQQINATQLSTQTFLSETEKRFAFYKCNNLTINFGSNFQKNV